MKTGKMIMNCFNLLRQFCVDTQVEWWNGSCNRSQLVRLCSDWRHQLRPRRNHL